MRSHDKEPYTGEEYPPIEKKVFDYYCSLSNSEQSAIRGFLSITGNRWMSKRLVDEDMKRFREKLSKSIKEG